MTSNDSNSRALIPKITPKDGLNDNQLKLVGGNISIKIMNARVEPRSDVSPASKMVGGIMNMGNKVGHMVTSGSKELLAKVNAQTQSYAVPRTFTNVKSIL